MRVYINGNQLTFERVIKRGKGDIPAEVYSQTYGVDHVNKSTVAQYAQEFALAIEHHYGFLPTVKFDLSDLPDAPIQELKKKKGIFRRK